MTRSLRRSGPPTQRGAALITVLLVFALAATLAVAMLERSFLNQRSVANLIGSRQAWHYALGGEAYARQLLAQDARRGTPGVDTLLEEWANAGAAPFDIGTRETGAGSGSGSSGEESSEMAVAIVDLQSRFNLNNLVNEQGAPDPAMTAALARLVARLGAPARLAAQWQDWIDADQQVGPDGAEDAEYGGERRTAGIPEADVSALRLLRDIDAEAYDRIAPYVATLPPGTPLNVNTASAEALQSLSSIIDAGLAARIVARQARGGFKDVQEFILFVGGDAELAARVAVGSRHFEAIVTVRHGDHWLRLRSQLERDPASGDIAVTARHRMPLDAAVPGEQNATRRVAARS